MGYLCRAYIRVLAVIDYTMKEVVEKEDGAKEVESSNNSIPLSPYSNLKRGLSEEDLKTPAVQRILLSEVDKLENRSLELESQLKERNESFERLKDNYHTVDKERSILNEKFNTSISQEVLYSFCLTSGSIIIGVSKNYWDKGFGWIFLVIGGFLILGGLISKAIKWK
jgi:hypothetical protein